MRILIDTNVFISAESMDDVDEFSESAAELYRLAMAGQHQVLMSQESKDDLSRQASGQRRTMRERQFSKYATIERIPLPDTFAARAGYAQPLSANDRVDLSLLLAVDRHAADYLVTQDGMFVVGKTANDGTGTDTLLLVPPDATGVAIAEDGAVSYLPADGGDRVTAGYLSLATFPNAAGLERATSNRWRTSPNSGPETSAPPTSPSQSSAMTCHGSWPCSLSRKPRVSRPFS